MSKEFIAYQGKKFTIEWYFDEREKSASSEYFESLPPRRKIKILHLFRLLGDTGKILNIQKFRYEGDQIYAFKLSPDRFLCFFFEKSKVVVTNAYEKKTTKMPAREKQRASKAKDDYLKRYKGGVYYD